MKLPFNRDKKTEVTKTECLATAITQWTIMNMLLNGRVVNAAGWHHGLYFTQLAIKSSRLIKGKACPDKKKIVLDALFTTMKHEEPNGREGIAPVRPSVHAEFELESATGAEMFLWKPVKATVKITNCLETSYSGATSEFTYDINHKGFRPSTHAETHFACYWDKLFWNGPVGLATKQEM